MITFKILSQDVLGLASDIIEWMNIQRIPCDKWDFLEKDLYTDKITKRVLTINIDDNYSDIATAFALKFL